MLLYILKPKRYMLLACWLVLSCIVAQADVIEIRADRFTYEQSQHELSANYSKPSIRLQAGDSLRFTANVNQAGHYQLFFDALALDSFISRPEGEISLGDSTLPVIFPIFYRNSQDRFPLDRYGNETFIRQERFFRWSKVPLRDASFNQSHPLSFDLPAGQHTFTLKLNKEAILLGSIYLQAFAPYPAYAEYLQGQPQTKTANVLLELEAEYPAYKNDTAIRPYASRNIGVSPYDTYQLLLNSMGGESWNSSGSTVFYEVTIPQDGLYAISLRYLQNFKNNFTVFRRITLDEQVLFDELNQVAFPYSSNWTNLTLGGETPYQIFLSKGTHTLALEATASPYLQAIENIQSILLDINTLALEIQKLTGNQADIRREWVITDYIPDIKDRLLAIADNIQQDLEFLKTIHTGGASQEILTYQMAIDNILFLANDPDKIPVRMNRFSKGSRSAAQLLNNLLTSLQSQPLALDKLYIHSPDTHPKNRSATLAASLLETGKRFIHSFKPDPYQSILSQADELNVWVNRPRQYVDLLQQMTDQSFSKDTGIKVKFSLMPDESKLVLAKAAGIQPDVALGVSTHIPYELAVRNALKDLRSFEDFDSYIDIFAPGSLLGYIINDSVYALPETQDFWVTFYRRDLLTSLNIPVPDTWDEVIAILPELQRYGMNYNTALSFDGAYKNYLLTGPYLFNHGANLYSADGFSTGLESEEAINAMRFMTESFTIYGMPLTTSSFYESFRYGSLPIGISNFETYLKLSIAAPELKGLWDIALYPATVLADGRQLRYATGSAQASIMFADTKREEEAWAFLKWWMSTGTQVEFQQQLVLSYGLEYLWSSANIEAFAYSPIPEQHKNVILEQWQWLQEPVRLPGSYMQEREISNAWNRVVFDGISPRVAIDSAILTINREIKRKMEEFGYLQNGEKVKTYKVPTLESIQAWMKAGQP